MSDNGTLQNVAYFYAYSFLRLLSGMKLLTDDEIEKIHVLNTKSFGSNLIIL